MYVSLGGIIFSGKLSGPLLDRIDLVIEVPALGEDELLAAADGDSSDAVRARVVAARACQRQRQEKINTELTAKEIDAHCRVDAAGQSLLKQAMLRFNLSARGYHRVLKVARSIADLTGATDIGCAHIAEAIHYRRGLAED